MKTIKQKCSVSNSGFTLIELIISMIILSIVILIVASFLYIGSKSYSSANTEVEKQMEVQTVMNQLEDLIIQSYWVKLVDINTYEEALIIYSQDKTSIVICNHNEKNLYLIDGTAEALNDLSSITYTKEENLMAEHVNDLKLLLDEDDMRAKNENQLETDFYIKDKVYPQIQTIHFRNQLITPTDTP